MRYLIILILLFSCSVCSAGYVEDGINFGEDDKARAIYHQLKMYNENSKNTKEILDKIYSMVADLEIKFMGQERYNQIYDPHNDGEVAKQETYTKEQIERIRKANGLSKNLFTK
jgi:DNA-binding transcriptional regulator YiaG